jgi:hypothetical protein
VASDPHGNCIFTLAAEVAKGLISLIKEWVASKKPVTVTIKGPKGEYEITGENISGTDMQKLAAQLTTG